MYVLATRLSTAVPPGAIVDRGVHWDAWSREMVQNVGAAIGVFVGAVGRSLGHQWWPTRHNGWERGSFITKTHNIFDIPVRITM